MWRRVVSFWGICGRAAVRGSFAFANDWQWLVGFPAIALIIWLLNRWFGEGSVTLLSQDTALGALEAAGIAFVLTWLLAVLRGILVAPAQLFFAEKDRADQLVARLLPRVTWDFDDSRDACMPAVVTNTGQRRRYVRVLPKNAGEQIAHYQAQLLRVFYRELTGDLWSRTAFDEALYLEWANYQQSMHGVAKGVDQYLDICFMDEQLKRLFPCVLHGNIPNRALQVFEKTGHYRFDVALVGEGAPPILSIQVSPGLSLEGMQARILSAEELGVLNGNR